LSALRGNTALDTSAIIEFLTGSELGRAVREYFETLKPTEKAYCSLYAVSEIFYILCRLRGEEDAEEKLRLMLGSRVIEVVDSPEMALEAGRLKCARAISIADCSCISTAKITDSVAVFAYIEEELDKEMKRKKFDVEILTLADKKR